MSEHRNIMRLACAYLFVSSVQLFSVEPYCDRCMYGLAIGLNAASWCGCALGLWVVILADESVVYPVPLLFGSWVSCMVLAFVLACCLSDEDPQRLKQYRPQRAYTELLDKVQRPEAATAYQIQGDLEKSDTSMDPIADSHAPL
eukprot:CAMPEP_0180796076 /NCGR_PEP_ID=MMETSP1038_2-20121128/56577_1 /TAXON_ID=632150 /ORGANISM="Azadinium spinosum, Strain 3D9" /LENGTH=143 /DNA_ID=CAMNT_0022835113 /DNA_START=35 /DNA_END=462 /DNA_ORIENTATION=+